MTTLPPATVVVCTYRHGADAANAIASVLAQHPAPDDVVLVRSGASPSDPLPAPLAHATDDARVRVVCEPRRGSALARACGIDASRHDVVLFLDDDATAHTGWFAALSAAMASADVAAAGGTILPRWPAPNGAPPRWLPHSQRSAYGERVGADATHPPFAANMAVRRSIIERAGGFPATLGHDGSTPGLHEETALCERLERMGHRVVHVPDAVVDHHVRDDQVRARWLLRRAWHAGSSDLRRDHYLGAPPQPRRRALKLAALVLALPASAVRAPWSVHVLARILNNAGYLRAYVGSRHAHG